MTSKIFQIGFNKCGTNSIYYLFKDFCNKELKCIHWEDGRVARAIRWHIENNVKPILGRYNNYDVFTDMEDGDNNHINIAHMDYFQNLDQEYPNSRFILNIRPIENWIRSRRKHINGEYLNYHAYINNISTEDTIELWKEQWYKHLENVKLYFSGRDNLLIYNIETDDFSKFQNFFSDMEFTINHLPHRNKS